MALSNSKLCWTLRPNFKYVAGPDEQPSNWGILYLKGSVETSKPCQGLQGIKGRWIILRFCVELLLLMDRGNRPKPWVT